MREDFTEYDIKPKEFINYLRYYGHHFNKKLCKFACEQFDKEAYDKEKLELLLQSYKIDIKNSKIYDAVYIANWCKENFFGSSITDEKHLLIFVKDVLEKEGNLVFNRWYADQAKLGNMIEWEDMI